MIFEELRFQFDVDLLRDHFIKNVLPLRPHMVSSHFGGWSVLSSNGSYLDGWVSGEKALEPLFMPGQSTEAKERALGLLPLSTYVVPTEVCTGYLATVMQQIAAAGLNPVRARLSILRAQGQSKRHRDAEDNEYCVRLHIPIITNPGCTFETDEGAVHLPADGRAYALRVNCMHQVFNRGSTDRLHLIMGIEDSKKFTTYHRHTGK